MSIHSISYSMKKFICNILSIVLLLTATTGCTDDPLYDPSEIGEGEAAISAEVTFRPLSTALSRSEGNAISSIKNIHVFVYKLNGQLERHIIPTDIVPGSNESIPDDYNGTQAEKTTASASFSIGKLPYGKYRIYAVANVSDDLLTDKATATEEGLKSISFQWNKDVVTENSQMFGYFTKDNKSAGFNATEIDINSASIKLKAWLKRAASKVTVAFDGSRLKDGISIYLKSVQIKDIPQSCILGQSNSPGSSDNDKTPADQDKIKMLLTDGEIIPYVPSETSYGDTWTARVSKQHPYYGLNEEALTKYYSTTNHTENDITALKADLHSENIASLYFYENMQGKGIEGTPSDKRQAVNEEDKEAGKPSYPDGNNPTDKAWKDAKPFGSYIEVKAFYSSEESCGNIIYRFMLGKDVTTDYNAERNHHYKLTMNFINDANNVDWHIDYDQQIFTVTQPKTFDYLGDIFISNEIPFTNYGHNFSKENPIIITSYNEQSPDKFNDCKVTFEDESGNFIETSDWLDSELKDISGKPHQKELVLKIKEDKLNKPDDEFTIDSKLKVSLKGSENAPYNLANSGSDGIINTANCYMIDAPGWYSLPLIYGNAIENGRDNKDAYICSYSDADFLDNFKNHLNNNITCPYITDHISDEEYGKLKETSAQIVWQDEQNLVSKVKYISDYYHTTYKKRDIGGIKFYIAPENIKQGNTVIAIKDSEGNVMWSWHIWVTNFDFQKTITVTTNIYGDRGRYYELMPVNLGWCSGHDDKVRIFDEHKWKVKIESGSLSETVEVVKSSHVAFTRGNNLYYQWGRKDPFWGTNVRWGNKDRWDGQGNSLQGNPSRFFQDSDNTPPEEGTIIDEGQRKNTREYLNELIKHPDIWHNPPRNKVPGEQNEFSTNNQTYSNLWGWVGDSPDASAKNKTVYDPCPIGYLVPNYNAFSGFAVKRWNDPNTKNYYDLYCYASNIGIYGYDVNKKRIEPSGNQTDNLYEFYTDSTKVYSIIFPETGYRDWDAAAGVYYFGGDNTDGRNEGIGYIWSRNIFNPVAGRTIWGVEQPDASYNLEFTRNINAYINKGIKPTSSFNTCDGMPIRPAAIPYLEPENYSESTKTVRYPLRRR